MNTHREYPTNVTQAQWQLLILLLPKGKWQKGGSGRPPANLRQVFNGILYLTKTGCQWRMLPPYLWLLANRVWLFQSLAQARHL